jgi:4'-phosphopantetheinyl transferase EntD
MTHPGEVGMTGAVTGGDRLLEGLLPQAVVVFSAKESVFKAWFPLPGRRLDFSECLITPDPERGTFTGVLRVPGPVVDGVRINRFTGRWRVLDGEGHGRVGTGVVVSRFQPDSAARELDAPVER